MTAGKFDLFPDKNYKHVFVSNHMTFHCKWVINASEGNKSYIHVDIKEIENDLK